MYIWIANKVIKIPEIDHEYVSEKKVYSWCANTGKYEIITEWLDENGYAGVKWLPFENRQDLIDAVKLNIRLHQEGIDELIHAVTEYGIPR